MSHEKVVFRAALARVVLGLYGLSLLRLMYPRAAALWPMFVAYLGIVAVFQVMIQRNIGGSVRSFVGGLVDIALLSFLVHRVGSSSTVLISLYLFAGTMNALVTTAGVAMALATVGAATYTAIVVAECMHWLPYGPDAALWASQTAPGLTHGLVSAGMLSLLSLFSTSMFAQMVKVVRQRETDLQSANLQLEEISQRDPLTQLYNRRHLFHRLELEIERIPAGKPLTVLMLDLDGFKRVNDETGHMRGDALLKEIALALQKHSRESDVAGRYGGDEFVVLLPGTDAAKAVAVAERVATAVREVGLRFDARRPVTASVGLAEAEEAEEVASVLRRADQAAYRAKQSGGNRVAA